MSSHSLFYWTIVPAYVQQEGTSAMETEEEYLPDDIKFLQENENCWRQNNMFHMQISLQHLIVILLSWFSTNLFFFPLFTTVLFPWFL